MNETIEHLQRQLQELEAKDQVLHAEYEGIRAQRAALSRERDAVVLALEEAQEITRLEKKLGRKVTVAPAGMASAEAFGTL
jgi:FtsZ-binding cell division protein ZapB